MDNPNAYQLNSIAADKVREFLDSMEFVKSKIVASSLVVQTTYGSRVFVRIKLVKSKRCLLKTIIKVSNHKQLDSLGKLLFTMEKICASYY